MQPWQKQKSTDFMEYKRSALPSMWFPTFCLQNARVHLTVFKGFTKPANDHWGKHVMSGEKVWKGWYKVKQVNYWLIPCPHFFHNLCKGSSYKQQLHIKKYIYIFLMTCIYYICLFCYCFFLWEGGIFLTRWKAVWQSFRARSIQDYYST